MFETKHEVKFYQIDTSFYEFKEIKNFEQIIMHIVNKHRKKILNEKEIDIEIPSTEIDGIRYYIYVFDQVVKESSWKEFLPNEITVNQDFNIRTVSFVLFSIVKDRIFAIIGGRGISVIKRYLNQSFGLDLFEKIADPTVDVVNIIESRGIVGNLSSLKVTYKDEQKLSDSLSFGRIPNKITLQLRDVLKDEVFNVVDFKNADKIYVEISTSFFIKWKLSFLETHQVLNRIDEILDYDIQTSLSRFIRIKDKNLTENSLRLNLYKEIRDDMASKFPFETDTYGIKFDQDFIHPSKLNGFYLCDRYAMYERNAKLPFYETNDRTTLYYAGLKFLYESEDTNTQSDFNYKISGIRVLGYINNEKETEAMFAQHLTCEISLNNHPIFLIDNKWYRVRNDFLSSINEQCSSMIRANYLKNGILDIPWDNTIKDEGEYNLKYSKKDGFIVLDKMLGDNIELCDLLYEDESTIYLIHVKKGFDAKMRDLSNQILISSKRLWEDIHSDFQFIDKVINRYSNSESCTLSISINDFRAKFKKEIIYVMAFNSQLSKNKMIINNVDKVKSNIAKFTLIQSVRDMQTNNYPLKIIEIANK